MRCAFQDLLALSDLPLSSLPTFETCDKPRTSAVPCAATQPLYFLLVSFRRQSFVLSSVIIRWCSPASQRLRSPLPFEGILLLPAFPAAVCRDRQLRLHCGPAAGGGWPGSARALSSALSQ